KVAHRISHCMRTVCQWRMRDRRGQMRIACGDVEYVSARDREAPDRHPVRIDLRQCARERDRGLPVGKLRVHAYALPSHATPFTQTAIIKGQYRVAGVVEPLGQQVGAGLLDHTQTCGHDHAGPTASGIMPRCAHGIVAVKVNLDALNSRRHADPPALSVHHELPLRAEYVLHAREYIQCVLFAMRCCAFSSTGSLRQRLERDMNAADGVPSSVVSMKVASSALEVPVVTPWMAGPHSAGDDPVIVSVTDFVTRR